MCCKSWWIAKYLIQTGETIFREQLCERLGIGDRTLDIGLIALASLGFEPIAISGETESKDRLSFNKHPDRPGAIALNEPKINNFILAIKEEQFYQQYFCQISIDTFKAMTEHIFAKN